jgi:hypothetical protein
MKHELKIRTANITKLDEEKDKLLNAVAEYQDDLIEQVKRLADTTSKEIRTEFEAEKTAITTDIESLDILIPTIETSLQKLSIPNEAQLFVDMKASKTNANDGKSVLSDLPSGWTTKRMSYTFDESLRSTVSRTKSFGTSVNKEDVQEYEAKSYGKLNVKDSTDANSFDESLRSTVSRTKTFGTPGAKEDVQEYEAKPYGKFNVEQSTDMSTSAITGICQLLDGSIVIVDYPNQKLKQLNSNYEEKNTLAVNGYPIGICDVSSNEVGVNMSNTGQIQFISVKDSMCLTSTIQVDKSCYGIYFNKRSDELFACCGSNINVYNKRGSPLRVLNTGPNGEQLFASLRQVILTDSSNEIVVTDYSKGLISINPQGKMNWFL